MNKALIKLRKEDIDADSLLIDVSDQQSIGYGAQQLRSRNVELDVLINNAAISLKEDKKISQPDETVLERILLTNSYGPLRMTKAFITSMKTPGRVIMISSSAGMISGEVMGYSPAYCVSKTLLNAITKQLADELKGKNIAVNAVCPGWVRTDMGGLMASRSAAKGAETPVWLATEAPQNLTGKFLKDKKEIAW